MTTKKKTAAKLTPRQAAAQKSPIRLLAELIYALQEMRGEGSIGPATVPFDELRVRTKLKGLGKASIAQIEPRLVALFTTPSITTEELASLLSVLNYVEADEKKDYMERAKNERSGHVYEHIKALRVFVKEQRGGKKS